jgi:hypothetical protein
VNPPFKGDRSNESPFEEVIKKEDFFHDSPFEEVIKKEDFFHDSPFEGGKGDVKNEEHLS